jgi:hypothetical protein
LIKGFLSDQKSIFTHPIKLAQCSDAELNEICSRNSR